MKDRHLQEYWMTQTLKRAINLDPGSLAPRRKFESKAVLEAAFYNAVPEHIVDTFLPIAASSDQWTYERVKPGVFRIIHVIGDTLGEHSILVEFTAGKSPGSERIALLCQPEQGDDFRIPLTQFDENIYQTALAPDDVRAEMFAHSQTRITVVCN